MVNYWLNWDEDIHNVIVSSNSSVCIGSCPAPKLFSVDQKLAADEPVINTLENKELTIVLFKSLTELRYVRNATSILLRYKTKKSSETLEIELGNAEKAEELFDHISQYVASHMIKRGGTTAPYYGLALMVSSVLFSAVFLYSFFNVHRIVAYVLPVLCVAGTFAYVIRQESKQRHISRWTTDSEVKAIGTPALTALGACLIFSALSLGASPFFHKNYGPHALYEAAKRGSLEAGEITGYLNRGSSINYVDEEGKSALWWSIENANEAVSVKLIHHGADVSANNGRLLEHAIENQASESLLRPMLKEGALEVAELIANFETKHYLRTKDNSFAKAFYWHRSAY